MNEPKPYVFQDEKPTKSAWPLFKIWLGLALGVIVVGSVLCAYYWGQASMIGTRH